MEEEEEERSYLRVVSVRNRYSRTYSKKRAGEFLSRRKRTNEYISPSFPGVLINVFEVRPRVFNGGNLLISYLKSTEDWR